MESKKVFSPENSNTILLWVIIGAVAFFVFIMPLIKATCDRDIDSFTGNLDDKLVKLDTRKCSPQCCKFSQWPLPPALRAKGPIKQEELDTYIGSNFSCGWGEGGGCVCMTKDDFDYLGDHAGNGNGYSCPKASLTRK